jgi:N-acetylneuraminic acid mutarotase
MRCALTVMVLMVGCGRVGYEPSPTSAALANDASLPGAIRSTVDADLEADTNEDAGFSDSPSDGGTQAGPADDSGSGMLPAMWRPATLPYTSGAGTAAVLADGLHYLGGASDYDGATRYRDHYVYVAATESWNAAPADLPDSDTWGAGGHVYRGKLYLIGGYPNGDKLRAFDPTTNGWTSLRAPPVVFDWGFASGVIGDGLYAFGGHALADTNADGYRYAFATNTWTKVASLPLNHGRGPLSSAVVGQRLYVLNGNIDDGTTVLQIYDSASDRWSTGASLSGHVYEGATAVAVGTRIYFLGGAADQDISDFSSDPAVLTNALNIYDTATDTWSQGQPMSNAKMYAAAAVYEGNLHVLGGLDARSAQIDDHEVLGL